MYTSILKILIILIGLVFAALGLLALLLVFQNAPLTMRLFHGLHFVLVVLSFILAYYAYKKYGHLLK